MNEEFKLEKKRTRNQETKQMSKEVKLEKKRTRKLTRADLYNSGPLHISENSKREGYHYRVIDTDKPGQLEKFLKLGYRVSEDKLKVGSDTVDKPTQLGSSVEVELSRWSKSRKGVVMEISNEDREEILKLKEEINEEQDRAIDRTGIETQYGKVTREYK